MLPVCVRRFSLLVPVAILCLLAGCGGGSSAYVKTINAYVDNQASFNLNVKIGGDTAAKNLAFGGATSPYAKVGAGSARQVQLSSAGGQPKPISIQNNLLKDHYYTLIATADGAALGATVVEDDLTPPSSGNIKIRFVNEAYTSGPVDIYVTAPNAVIDNPQKPVTPTMSNVAIGTVGPYLQIPGGQYWLWATAPGDPTHIISLAVPQSPLTAGAIYTSVLVDPYNPPNTTVIMGAHFLLTQDQPVAGVKPVAPTP